MTRDQALETITAQLTQYRRLCNIVGGTVILFAAVLAIIFRDRDLVGLLVGVGSFGALGIGLVAHAELHMNPRRAPVLVALSRRSSEIAWIYRMDIRRNGVLQFAAVVRLFDGADLRFDVATGKVQEVFEALRVLAPNAVEGYSADRAAQFKADPRSFARS